MSYHVGSFTLGLVSPTVFRWKGYRFYFFSREEPRLHIHITCADGEAKFWLDPLIALADNRGLNFRQLRKIQEQIEENQDEIRKAWKKHFKS